MQCLECASGCEICIPHIDDETVKYNRIKVYQMFHQHVKQVVSTWRDKYSIVIDGRDVLNCLLAVHAEIVHEIHCSNRDKREKGYVSNEKQDSCCNESSEDK